MFAPKQRETRRRIGGDENKFTALAEAVDRQSHGFRSGVPQSRYMLVRSFIAQNCAAGHFPVSYLSYRCTHHAVVWRSRTSSYPPTPQHRGYEVLTILYVSPRVLVRVLRGNHGFEVQLLVVLSEESPLEPWVIDTNRRDLGSK